ncbi:GH25 family lysozyme [Lacticaseibacillus saniviri]|uniref:Lysin n=1 Tax=Lacticaseibacillus saniviri JCM 17471 = DSM 24301 TaxID=1293598 RepID=A0A0R2MSJ1_9LACO|nr:GH25 family lysozyme [Lacticaseibacillus saniviri]KRO16534.1 lysin [Lacticaseibacillus saniviri JCM 17471 = DSM 24301]
MKLKFKLVVAAVIAAFLMPLTVVSAARTDMVDVSNHNGQMYTSDLLGMRNTYGIKAMVTKISEGVGYADWTAAGNIAAAKAAGIYVNGYHFARYNSVAGAINEANYAATVAKNAGLPVGAVLVADVEAEQQTWVSKATIDAANAAWRRTVESYGYRTDIYTMGSWLGYRMTVPYRQGWIANYPYNATNLNLYSSNHAWQWGYQYNFSGTTASGAFDVSQLYDTYYTADQTPVGGVGVSVSNVVKVKYVARYGVNALDKYGRQIKDSNQRLKHGTSWKANGVYTLNGVEVYSIGGGWYLPQQYSDQAGKVTIKYVPNYGVLASNSNGKQIVKSNTKFKHGTSWKYSKAVKINNRVYYKVSNTEYIDSRYTIGG